MALKGEKPQERRAVFVERPRWHGLREKALKENGIAGEDDRRLNVGGRSVEEKPQGPGRKAKDGAGARNPMSALLRRFQKTLERTVTP
jgi:hypothetical protein